jgi:hypothetical protein
MNMKVYDVSNLKMALMDGPVIVKFTKANGELREMNCTLCPSLVPQEENDTAEPKKERKQNPDIQPVWDLDKEAWRSFRYDSIVEIVS